MSPIVLAISRYEQRGNRQRRRELKRNRQWFIDMKIYFKQ